MKKPKARIRARRTPASIRLPRGADLLHDPLLNKGTAFTETERDALGLRGLLPPRVLTQDVQVMRAMESIRRKPSDLEKYIYLVSLQDRNETLFYRVLADHLEEMMPLIYTPTVGEACRVYGHIFRRPRGLFVSAKDRGRIRELLSNWPHRDPRVVVVTDGERILGLGDLGANGMGIPVGKLTLYAACAGIRPEWCLPVTLDVGTDNDALRSDPLYVGLCQRRLRGSAYDELLDEFLRAVAQEFPRAIIQLEDFSTHNAFGLLERYRDRLCLFDDDIQGTAAVVLAGLRAAIPMTDVGLADQKVLFFGAGEAGIGAGRLIVAALVREGWSEPEARARCWYFDSKGLVVNGRPGLPDHKRPFAHRHPPIGELREAILALRPTALIGVSGVASAFHPSVLEAMASVAERPLILPLSNPTSHAECTAESAYRYTGGRAIFASGSPFGMVRLGGQTWTPGQANNAYVFPGVGLGAIVSETRRITDEMFLAAADALAGEVTPADLQEGRIYPPIEKIRTVSTRIAAAVAEVAFARRLARAPKPSDLMSDIRSRMFEPTYPIYAGSSGKKTASRMRPSGKAARAEARTPRPGSGRPPTGEVTI